MAETASIEDYHFLSLNEALLQNPYPFYKLLREQAPVWQDPRTEIYEITRFEDPRRVYLDTERASDPIESDVEMR